MNRFFFEVLSHLIILFSLVWECCEKINYRTSIDLRCVCCEERIICQKKSPDFTTQGNLFDIEILISLFDWNSRIPPKGALRLRLFVYNNCSVWVIGFRFLFLFIDAQFHRIWKRLYNYKHYNEINWVFIRIFSLFSKTIFIQFFFVNFGISSCFAKENQQVGLHLKFISSINNVERISTDIKRIYSLGTKFVHLLKCFSNHDAVGGVFFSQNPESIGFEAMIRISLLKAQIIYHCYVNAAWCLLNIFFVIWFQMVHKMSRRQIE